jgi:DNA mismatch endonuclease (patch repair protein)
MYHKNSGSFSVGHFPWNKGLTKDNNDSLRKSSEEMKMIPSSFKGKHHSEESREKISNSLKGHLVSDETRKKIGNANVGKLKGIPRSDDVKRKISESEKGRIFSNETRSKMSTSRKRQILPLRDTSIEIKMQNILTDNDIKFEKHRQDIFGYPDIFIDPNICIFCDGDYWHNFPDRLDKDRIVNIKLSDLGYIVLRFWEHEINDDLNECFRKVNCAIHAYESE